MNDLLSKLLATGSWLPPYLAREIGRRQVQPKHLYLCICDHFEPYGSGAGRSTAQARIRRWLEEYPQIAEKQRDADGQIPRWTFFYPEEEYREDDLNELARLCHAGFGAVEVHLHHDNDTAENLRRTLLAYKQRLHEKHGLLSVDPASGEIVYGFIHGNWALCNSRPDRCWCGVNEEIKVLMETGCYADFTMPSAPSPTQTRKVNSIYYALDKPGRPKSHDWGVDAEVGKRGEGLLMVQGPLALDWGRRKFGLLPRIEHSGLLGNFPPSAERARLWIDAGISVKGAPEHVFVKLYTHGAQEEVMRMLFDDGGIAALYESIGEECSARGIALHYVTAREMVQVIRKICET